LKWAAKIKKIGSSSKFTFKKAFLNLAFVLLLSIVASHSCTEYHYSSFLMFCLFNRRGAKALSDYTLRLPVSAVNISASIKLNKELLYKSDYSFLLQKEKNNRTSSPMKLNSNSKARDQKTLISSPTAILPFII
jgi:hypothetical protein